MVMLPFLGTTWRARAAQQSGGAGRARRKPQRALSWRLVARGGRASLYAATKASATAVVASAVEAKTDTLRPSLSVSVSTGFAAHTVRDWRDAAPLRRGKRSDARAGALRTTGEAVSIMMATGARVAEDSRTGAARASERCCCCYTVSRRRKRTAERAQRACEAAPQPRVYSSHGSFSFRSLFTRRQYVAPPPSVVRRRPREPSSCAAAPTRRPP